jgi:hypothetical protein
LAFGTAYDARVPLLTRFVIIAVLAYVVLVGVVWLLQERFIFYPQLGREIVATHPPRAVCRTKKSGSPPVTGSS